MALLDQVRDEMLALAETNDPDAGPSRYGIARPS
jgi:hypothetical protein